MPCPKCGSNDLWDDNLAWGCSRCRWFTTGNVRNTYSTYDRFQPEICSEPPKERERLECECKEEN